MTAQGARRAPLQFRFILAALLLSSSALSQRPEEQVGLRLIAVSTEA